MDLFNIPITIEQVYPVLAFLQSETTIWVFLVEEAYNSCETSNSRASYYLIIIKSLCRAGGCLESARMDSTDYIKMNKVGRRRSQTQIGFSKVYFISI